MIRLSTSTILERPMLTRSDRKPTTEQCVKHHIRELPSMIRCFRNAIVSVSRESKWGKLALMRNDVPIEIFDLVKPFLMSHGQKDFYPNVSCGQWVTHRKYLLIEAKIYRLELAHDSILDSIRNYIMDSCEFQEESKRQEWNMRQFNQYDKRIKFIERVLELRYLATDEGVAHTEYDIERMMNYWF